MQGDIDTSGQEADVFYFKVYYQNTRRHIVAVTAFGLSNFTDLDFIIKVAEPSRLGS